MTKHQEKKNKTKGSSEEELAYLEFLKDLEIGNEKIDEVLGEARHFNIQEEFYNKITDLDV